MVKYIFKILQIYLSFNLFLLIIFLALHDKDVEANIRTLLMSAVEKRLMGDRRIGCLLSGGLDSSLIAALTVRLAKMAKFNYSIQVIFLRNRYISKTNEYQTDLSKGFFPHTYIVQYIYLHINVFSSRRKTKKYEFRLNIF